MVFRIVTGMVVVLVGTCIMGPSKGRIRNRWFAAGGGVFTVGLIIIGAPTAYHVYHLLT